MTNHCKVYHKSFGFDYGDFIGCEICGKLSVDIHHINPREFHVKAHNEIYDKQFLREIWITLSLKSFIGLDF